MTAIMSVRKTSPMVMPLPSCRPRRLGPGFGRNLGRRDVLRDVVGLETRNAVVVRPAIDGRKFFSEISVPGRRVRRLPLERGGMPGIAAGRLAPEVADEQVVQEHHLCGADDKRG